MPDEAQRVKLYYQYVSQASSSASNGDMEAAKQYNIGSLTCTVISLVSAVIPIIAFVIWIATL